MPIKRKAGPFGGPKQTEKVVTANVFQYELGFPQGNLALERLPDVVNMDNQGFLTMTPPRTAPGFGQNTLNTCGVWGALMCRRATADDPYQRNFVGFKLDHAGWNVCNPRQWNQNVTQFENVRMSPVVLEITMPDPPMSRALAVTQTRPAVMTDAQLTAYQALNMDPAYNVTIPPMWNETRPQGVWQYIVIPPQKAASVNLGTAVGFEQWQRLLQIGFKPRTCTGTTYKISVQPRGLDSQGLERITTYMNTFATGPPYGVIPPFNNGGLTQGLGTMKMHTTQECDWCCQYDNGPYQEAPITSVPAGFVNGSAQVQTLLRQGFDVVAFGSAIVFQFCQYAPLTFEGTQTATPQAIGLTLTVHSKTVFSKLRSTSTDLGQITTLPITYGV